VCVYVCVCMCVCVCVSERERAREQERELERERERVKAKSAPPRRRRRGRAPPRTAACLYGQVDIRQTAKDDSNTPDVPFIISMMKWIQTSWSSKNKNSREVAHRRVRQPGRARFGFRVQGCYGCDTPDPALMKLSVHRRHCLRCLQCCVEG